MWKYFEWKSFLSCKGKPFWPSVSISGGFEQDVNKIHPPKFCNKCYCTMQNCNLQGTKTAKCPVKWKEGSASNFSKIKSKGGRPIKSKKGERPKKNH